MQHATLTTEQVRALIARGKLRDTLFQALGIFFLGVGLIVIVVSLLCAATSHVTVLSHLSHLDGDGDA